jgi:hypothetical protein
MREMMGLPPAATKEEEIASWKIEEKAVALRKTPYSGMCLRISTWTEVPFSGLRCHFSGLRCHFYISVLD